MITNSENREIEKFGDLPEEKAFQIKNSAKAFRIFVGNLYSDKVGAIVRELSANAADSHTAKQNNNPFEVSLPTRFEPVITIRDFGTGLSPEFMLNEYTTAFYSSKDKSNDFMGAMGLGRLSALSLCDNYSCSSFQNGTKRNYSVYINETGVPAIMPLGEEQTNEPNGFLVEVPVSPELTSDFENRAREVYRHYPIKPIIKNRNNFEIPNDTYIISAEDNSFGLKGTGHLPQAIMGTYSYPISINSIPDLSPVQTKLLQSGIVIKFDIGSLQVTANREALYYTKGTVENLKKRLDEISLVIQPIVLKQFEGKNIFEKSALQYDLISCNGKLHGISELVKQFIYDLKIPSQIAFEDCQVISFTKTYSRGKERIKKSEVNSIEYHNNVILYYADKKSHCKLKAEKFFENKDNQGKRIVFIYPNSEDTAETINKFKIKYDFDLLTLPKASSLPFEKPVAGEREFNVLEFVSGFVCGRRSNAIDTWQADEDFDPEDEVVYIERVAYEFNGNVTIGYNRHDLKTNIARFNEITGQNVTIYGLTQRQIKNKKAHWQTFEEVYKKAIEDYTNNQTEKISAWKYFQNNYSDFPIELLNKLDCGPDTLAAQIKNEYLLIKDSFEGVNAELAQKSQIEPANQFKLNTETLKATYPLLFLIEYYEVESQIKKDLEDYIILKS